MSIEHFVIATTKEDWQVLRHFYIYGHYRYGKLVDTEILDVMEQWYNHGKYVFYCRPRMGMSYYNDSWTRWQPTTIKRGGFDSWREPREFSYCEVRYERLTEQFKYIGDLQNCNIGKVFRAVNTDPIWETIFKQNMEEYIWCAKANITENEKKTIAVKVARRHHYNYRSPEWCDMVDNLIYLGKDIHNPHFVCPQDLNAMHDEMSIQARCKRERITRVQIEAAERERRERQQRMELERIERDKKAREEYPKARNRFFGILIEGQGLQIKCLQSVEEFKAEGEAMHHCVFGNSYYDMKTHPNSLILSAKRDGERVETIEVDLRDYSIVQSRGKFNQNTKYHDTIVKLMTDNMGLIKQANMSRRAV